MGLVLLGAGITISRNAFDSGVNWGNDLATSYVAGWMLREGRNIYDFELQRQGFIQHVGYLTTWAHFYPPAVGVIMLPVTLLSYPAARELYFYVLIAGMLWPLWRVMAVYAPHWDRSVRVLALGAVMCAATTRWSFKVAQSGPLVLGMFCLFVIEIRSTRTWLAFLCASAITAMKVTFGIPFVLMAAAHRRLKLATALIALSVVLNLIGMYRMGGPSILVDYRANMADFERPDQLNYPDPRGFNSLARTDWPYLLNAIAPDLERNAIIGYGLTAANLAWLMWIVLRSGSRVRDPIPTIVLTGPVVALSMLAVYHHHYDMNIMLLPVMLYLAHPEIRRRAAAWFYIVPIGLYAGLYPYEKFAQLAERLIGPQSILLSKPLACIVCVVALVGSGILLRDVLRSDEPLHYSSQ